MSFPATQISQCLPQGDKRPLKSTFHPSLHGHAERVLWLLGPSPIIIWQTSTDSHPFLEYYLFIYRMRPVEIMAMYTLSVSCPRSARRRYVASSRLPSTQACPEKIPSTPRKLQRKEQWKVAPLSAEAMKEGVGRILKSGAQVLAFLPSLLFLSLGVPPLTPHSRRLPRPGLRPTSPHLWQRGSPKPAGCTRHWRGGP